MHQSCIERLSSPRNKNTKEDLRRCYINLTSFPGDIVLLLQTRSVVCASQALLEPVQFPTILLPQSPLCLSRNGHRDFTGT